MEYFDLVQAELHDRHKAKTLGFKRIFTTKEIAVSDDKESSSERCIVRSGEPGLLGRALKRNNVIGIMIKDSERLKMIVEEVRENEKLLVFNAHELTCVDTRAKLRNLYRMRGLLSAAMKAKAEAAIVTLAEDEACMLSSMQMIEIAKFLGAGENYAKRMVGNLGGMYDN